MLAEVVVQHTEQGRGIDKIAIMEVVVIEGVGVIGGVSAEKVDPAEIPESSLLDDVDGLYQ